MDNFPSNSDKSKRESEQHKFSPVIPEGSSRVMKGKIPKKISNTFFKNDINDVKSYIVTDVLIPAAKNLIFSTISNSLSMLMFGEVRNNPLTGFTRQSDGVGRISRTSYSKFYDQRETIRDERITRGYEYDELSYNTREEADTVLAEMDDALYRYGVVSIFDMYDFSHLTAPFTYQDYGWTNLRSAKVIDFVDEDGYVRYAIDLPRVIPIRPSRR